MQSIHNSNISNLDVSEDDEEEEHENAWWPLTRGAFPRSLFEPRSAYPIIMVEG
jgi:hypothetical protein